MTFKIIALVVLVGLMLGLAWDIERKARPVTGKGKVVPGGSHDH